MSLSSFILLHVQYWNIIVSAGVVVDFKNFICSMAVRAAVRDVQRLCSRDGDQSLTMEKSTIVFSIVDAPMVIHLHINKIFLISGNEVLLKTF